MNVLLLQKAPDETGESLCSEIFKVLHTIFTLEVNPSFPEKCAMNLKKRIILENKKGNQDRKDKHFFSIRI